jgi:hypothetical protein
MDCERIERNDLIERYVAGKLESAEQEEFETHYFGCPECLEKLRTGLLIQASFQDQGEKILALKPYPPLAPIRRRAWAYSAAAGMLIVAAAALWLQLARPGRAPAGAKATPSSLTLLARIDPPSYVPLALRGTDDAAAKRFRLAMNRYSEGRYEEAIPDLQDVVEFNPRGAGGRFFLGICLLLTGKTDRGMAELRETVSLGDSVFLEEAHFFLAKAFLAKGDARGAKDELAWVMEKGIRLKPEAARIFVQLR